MAHNLNINPTNGKAAFASGNNQVAWHNLGQVVEGAMTAEQAIKLALLDYEVGLKPATIDVDKNFSIVVPNNFVTYRKDTNMPFGVVGNRYKIVQNNEAFNFFDAIVGGDMAMYETAGALGNGERIFVSAKMPDFIRIAGTDDLTEVYVLLTSSHDGSGSIIAAVTPVRVVCQNTLNAALGNTISRVAIRHTTNAKKKLEEAHKLMGISHKFVEELNECFNVLAKKKITDEQVRSLIEELFKSGKKEEVEGDENKEKESTRILNIRNKVWEGYQEGVGQSSIIGTAWGAYNGITHYLDHTQSYKSGDVKFDSIMSGAGYKVATNALNLLMKM